jgi:hypothetical protein
MSDCVEGRIVRISRPAEAVYMVFSDFSHFTRFISADIMEKYELKIGEETVIGKAYGFELGMQIAERTPFSGIVYKQYGRMPIEFSLAVNITTLAPGTCDFQLILETELPGIYKMMLGNKLQEVVDKLTDNIEAGFNMGVGYI